MSECVFCKIVEGKIASRKAYEDDEILAFHDINPAAPVHVLVIPKRHIETLAHAGPGEEAILGRILALTGRIAREQGSPDGYRTIINTGRVGGQDVYHLHVHILGGPRPLTHMVAKE